MSDVRGVGVRDPHEVLGVPPGADRQQVMRAFQRRVRKGGHPDTGGDAQTFDELIRARNTLLDRARHSTDAFHRRSARTGPATNAGPRPTHAPPRSAARSTYSTPPAHSPPRETSKLAIVTAVLALLGPFMWPVAILVGHLALRQIKRTGQGGGTLVPVVLFFLYAFTLPVLLRILSLVLIP